VWWAVVVTWAHAALHLVVPPIMLAQRSLFVDQLQRVARQPSDRAVETVTTLLRASLAYHLVLASLFVILGALIVRRPRNWARLLLTIVLTLGLAGTAFSFSSPTPMPLLYKSLNVLSWLLACAPLAALWACASARAFFRSRR
jgi:hypothetical protein